MQACIEVAQSNGAWSSNVLSGDMVIRTAQPYQRIHVCIGSNDAVPLVVSAGGVAVMGNLTANGATVDTSLLQLGNQLRMWKQLGSNTTLPGGPAYRMPNGYINPLSPGDPSSVSTTDGFVTLGGMQHGNWTSNSRTFRYTPQTIPQWTGGTCNVLNYTGTVAAPFSMGTSTVVNTIQIWNTMPLTGGQVIDSVCHSVPTNTVNSSVVYYSAGIFATTDQQQFKLIALSDSNNYKSNVTPGFIPNYFAGGYTVPTNNSNHYLGIQVNTLNQSLFGCNLPVTGVQNWYTTTGCALGATANPFTRSVNWECKVFSSACNMVATSSNMFLTTVSNLPSPLQAPTSNVSACALATRLNATGGTSTGVYNSNMWLDVTADAGSNWSTVALSNMGIYDAASNLEVVMGRAAVTPGTQMNWRWRMTSNVGFLGVAIQAA